MTAPAYHCPDCGARWEDLRGPCPGCLLLWEDVQAAALFVAEHLIVVEVKP
jgi:hypothetical protein